MTNHDVHTIVVDQGKRQIEIKIPVPLPKADKERLKALLITLVDLALDPPAET
ncbi:MAG: hypothetical protein IGS54_08025 [Elainella sp. C42_A2020_010]|nr:hypothetical protein [Elainella sp. C42_A2020_010]